MRTIGCLGSLMGNRTPNGEHPYCNRIEHTCMMSKRSKKTSSDKGQQRIGTMRKVLEEAKWCWGVDAICVVQQFHKAIDFAKSQQPSTDPEASRELRLFLPELKPVHLESCIVFHRNLKTFTEMMTGQLTEVTEITLFYFYHLSKTGAA